MNNSTPSVFESAGKLSLLLAAFISINPPTQAASSFAIEASADSRFLLTFSDFGDARNQNPAQTAISPLLLHDLTTGKTETIELPDYRGVELGQNLLGGSLGGNGRFIAFEAPLNSEDQTVHPRRSNIFVYDCWARTVRLVSTAQNTSTPGNGDSWNAKMASSATQLYFESFAFDLVDDDQNNSSDAFAYSFHRQTVTRLTPSNQRSSQTNPSSRVINIDESGNTALVTSGLNHLAEFTEGKFGGLYIWNATNEKLTHIDFSRFGAAIGGNRDRPAFFDPSEVVLSGAGNKLLMKPRQAFLPAPNGPFLAKTYLLSFDTIQTRLFPLPSAEHRYSRSLRDQTILVEDSLSLDRSGTTTIAAVTESISNYGPAGTSHAVIYDRLDDRTLPLQIGGTHTARSSSEQHLQNIAQEATKVSPDGRWIAFIEKTLLRLKRSNNSARTTPDRINIKLFDTIRAEQRLLASWSAQLSTMWFPSFFTQDNRRLIFTSPVPPGEPTSDVDSSTIPTWNVYSLNLETNQIEKITPDSRELPPVDHDALWATDLGASALTAVSATPERTLISASLDGVLAAIDPSSGTELWRTHSIGPTVGAPAIAASTICVGDLQGNLSAFDAATGAPLWQRTFPRGGTAPPVIERDEVIWATEGGKLHFVDLQTGAVKHSFEAKERIAAAPAIDLNGIAYFADMAGWVYALDTKTRSLHWSTQLENSVEAGISLDFKGYAYLGGWDGIVRRLTTQQGEIVWERDLGTPVAGTPLISNTGHVIATGFDGHIYGIDLHTGQQHWSYDAGMTQHDSICLDAHDRLFLGNATRELIQLEASTGVELSRLTSPGLLESSPLIHASGNRLTSTTRDGRVVTFEIPELRPAISAWPRANRHATSNAGTAPLANAPPSIISQPRSLRFKIGERLEIPVQISRSPDISGTWFHDGVALVDQTRPTLSISESQATSIGQYTFVARTVDGELASDPITAQGVIEMTPSIRGNGRIQFEDSSGIVAPGDSLTATAIPRNQSWVFQSWEYEDQTSTDNPLTFAPNHSGQLLARFTKNPALLPGSSVAFENPPSRLIRPMTRPNPRLLVAITEDEDGHSIVAYDLETEAVQWRRPVPRTFTTHSPSQMISTPDQIALLAGELTLLDLDGAILNVFQINSKGILYWAGPDLLLSDIIERLLAYDTTTGAKLWETEFNHITPTASSLIYGGHQSSFTRRLAPIDALTGQPAGSRTYPRLQSFPRPLTARGTPIAILDQESETIYEVSGNKLKAYHAYNSEPLWAIETPETLLGFRATTPTGLVIGRKDPESENRNDGILFIDKKTGAVRWRAPTPTPFPETLSSGETIYFSTAEGLTAFDTQTGEIHWRSQISMNSRFVYQDYVYGVNQFGELTRIQRSEAEITESPGTPLPNSHLTRGRPPEFISASGHTYSVGTGRDPTGAFVTTGTEIYARFEGTLPFEFQWWKDGEAIEGANATILTVKRESYDEPESIYQLQAKNAYGEAWSTPIPVEPGWRLTVLSFFDKVKVSPRQERYGQDQVVTISPLLAPGEVFHSWTFNTAPPIQDTIDVLSPSIQIQGEGRDLTIGALVVPDTNDRHWASSGLSFEPYAPGALTDTMLFYGYSRSLEALDRFTGDSIWRKNIEIYSALPPILPSPNVVIFPTIEGSGKPVTLSAYDATNGSTLWSVTSNQKDSFPAIDAHETIWLGNQKYNRNSGTDNGLLELPEAPHIGSVSIDTKGRLFAVGGERRHVLDTIFAIDPENQVISWKATHPDLRFRDGVALWHEPPTSTNPADRSVAVCSTINDGTIIALDGDTGTELWRVQVEPEKARQSLPDTFPTNISIASSGQVYLGARGTVYAVDIRSGSILWEATPSKWGPNHHSIIPVVASDGTVFVSESIQTHRLDSTDGSLIAKYLGGSWQSPGSIGPEGNLYLLDLVLSVHKLPGVTLDPNAWQHPRGNATNDGRLRPPTSAVGLHIYVDEFGESQIDITSSREGVVTVESSQDLHQWIPQEEIRFERYQHRQTRTIPSSQAPTFFRGIWQPE